MTTRAAAATRVHSAMAGNLQYIKELPPEPCSYWPEGGVTAQLYAVAGISNQGRPIAGMKAHELMRPAHLEAVTKGFLAVHFGAVAPVCSTCRACVPLRVNTDKFSLSESQEKKLAKDPYRYALVDTPSLAPHHELYAVFRSYVLNRHAEETSLMRMWKRDRFHDWLQFMPFMLTARDKNDGRLRGFAAINGSQDMAILEYIAFCPADSARSPGKKLWLNMMMMMKEAGIPHVYVGSWAKDSPKLDYKKCHRGLETFDGEKWVDFDPEIHTQGPDYRAMLRAEGFNL